MSNRIFHGGCHGCQSQSEHGLERCKMCQYYNDSKTQVNWKLENLYIPVIRDLYEIVVEEYKRWEERRQQRDRHSRGGEPKVTQNEDGTVFVTSSYGDHMIFKSIHDAQKYLELTFDPKRVERDIRQQIEYGAPVSKRFLESFGTDFYDLLPLHPNYAEEILKKIEQDDDLIHLYPQDVIDTFVF